MARNQVCTTTLQRTLTAVATNILRFRAPVTGQIIRVRVWVGTAPDGGTALFDVNVNGTSIWNADQSQRITIPDGGTDHERTGLTAAVTKDQQISVDFDGFTGTATGIGTFLQIVIEIEETGASATDAELGGGGLSGVYLPIEAEVDQGNAYATTEWDTPVRDDGGYYNISNASPVIPADGWYTISLGLIIHSTEAGKIQVDVTVDGSLVMRLQALPLAGDETFSMSGSVSTYALETNAVFVTITQSGTPGFAVEVIGTYLSVVPA